MSKIKEINQNKNKKQTIKDPLTDAFRNPFKRHFNLTFVLFVATIIVVPYLFTSFALGYGNSMAPVIEDSICIDVFIKRESVVHKLYPKAGEIWLAKTPDGDQVVKRYVGSSMDHYEMKDNVLYNNDIKVPGYSKQPSSVSINEEVVIPDNEINGTVVLMGDNYLSSTDSREYGPVKKDDLISKFWFSIKLPISPVFFYRYILK